MTEGMTLASVLRAWRERISPADAGFPGGRGSRRVPGLRREELAWLASISPDYIKRLEQGRAHPGSDVVRALARALRLSQEEYELLSRLAGHAGDRAGQVPWHVTPGAQRLADRLHDVPVGIYDATWTLLSWNQPWASLIGDPGVAQGRKRHLVWLYFTGAPHRIQHPDPAGMKTRLWLTCARPFRGTRAMKNWRPWCATSAASASALRPGGNNPRSRESAVSAKNRA